MKPDNDLSVLAGKLTKAQREILLRWYKSGPMPWASKRKLAGMGLVFLDTSDTLTSLGIALRNHLLDEDSRHG